MYVHANVNSRVDYHNAFHMGLPLRQLGNFGWFKMRHTFIRPGKIIHVTPILSCLHLLPVFFQVQFKVLIFTFKA